MKKIIYLFLIIFLVVSCNEKNEDIKSTGKLVFYSNAQAMLNEGSFDVEVFIDSVLVGSVSNPYVNEGVPECGQSENTLLIEKETGTINYYAKISCDDYIQWTGTVDVKSDSCQKIFLDIQNAEDLRPKGRAVFYTDILGAINCGPNHVVRIFIDNDTIGVISETTVDGKPEPDCINSESSVMMECEQGIYSYSAELDCGGLIWNGEFEIFPDSCTKVFLDRFDATNPNDTIGEAVFYTNAQALYDCRPIYFVKVFVDNDSLGYIFEPYLSDTPYCTSSNKTLLFTAKYGTHSFTAKTTCGNIEWSGEFEIVPDSCAKIFLDVSGKF